MRVLHAFRSRYTHVLRALNVSAYFSVAMAMMLVLVTLPLPNVEAFSGSGSGTMGDPYIITDCEELTEINDELGAHYRLANNIDCGFTSTEVLFTEDFEGATTGWTHSGDNDSWQVTDETCSDTLPSLAYGTNGNESVDCDDEDDEDSELISPVIALNDTYSHYIQFDSWADDEGGACTDSGDYDMKDVAVTTDGGSSYTILNDCFALNDSGTTTYVFPINGFDDEDIQIMFRYDTGDDCCGLGWYVDNIEVGEGHVFTPIGNNDDRFYGSLDGNDFEIQNIAFNWGDYAGLFGVIAEDGEVFDLTLPDVDIAGSDFVGAAAGASYGTITGVTASGSVDGYDYVGGLVGAHADPDGLGSSSPLLFTWNGSEYDYQVDLGGTLPFTVDGADWAPLHDGALVPQDDTYSMKISQEYDEIVYFDELELYTVDHAPGYGVASSMHKDFEEVIYSYAESPTNPVLSCTDRWGNDCAAAVGALDDSWTVRNDAEPDNYWIMDFGDLSAAENIYLIAEGFSDYSIDTITREKAIQVKNAEGEWVDAFTRGQIDPPKGAPRTKIIDMTDSFLTDDYSVRVAFPRARMNWFAIDTTEQTELTVNSSDPTSVELYKGGYTNPDKTTFWDHDYRDRSMTPFEFLGSPNGNFTKYGDITPLLLEDEDQYAVLRHGDWMDIEFDYTAPADGLERSIMVYNWSLYKHWDKGDWARTVEPLPYHGMTEYPYVAPDTYPYTTENNAYLAEWNTRVYENGGWGSNTIIDSGAAVDVFGCEFIGGLVGYNYDEDISGSFATGDVTSDDCDEAGGLVGYTEGASISDSYATGNIYDADEYVGGFVGTQYDGEITGSYATGEVNGYERVGGFVGRNQNGTIEQSYATGDVDAEDNHVGGFAGGNGGDAEIINSYARGDVDGYEDVAGFSGNNGGTITNSYSTGSVSADDDDGGFVATAGGSGPAEANFSFWDTQTSGLSYSEMGTGKTTAQMKSLATFTTDLEEDAWDFDTIWGINSTVNDGYPDFIENLPVEDNDGDGIGNSVEDAGPNGGDSNGDGTPDRAQNNVTTFVNSVNSSYMSFESTCLSNDSVEVMDETDNGMEDEAFDYMLGFVGFTLTCGTPGETATVTMYFYGDYDASLVTVRKFNDMTDTYTTIDDAVVTNTTIGGEAAVVVMYDVTDGGELDEDGVANGTIVDPVGAAFNTAAAPQTGLGGSAK